MTTSLSTTSANEIFPAATAPGNGTAALPDGCAALLATADSAVPTGPGAPLTPEFATLLAGGTTTAADAAQGASTLAASDVRSTTACANGVAETPVAVSPAMPTDVRGFSLKPTRAVAAPPSAEGRVGEDAEAAASDSVLPDRSTLEAIVSLLMPVAIVVESAPGAGAPAEAAGTSSAESFSTVSSDPQITWTRPGQPAVPLDRTLSPATSGVQPSDHAPAKTELATAASGSGAATGVPVPALAPTNVPMLPAAPAVAAASAMPAQPTATDTQAGAAVASAPTERPMIEATASVEMADGAVIALALPKISLRTAARAEVNATLDTRPEKSAALPVAEAVVDPAAEMVAGKKFLKAGEQELTVASREGGIGVAETETTMLFTPHDTLSTVHTTVPAIVSMVSAAPQAAGAPAAEPMPQLVAASVAHRAVEAVTSIVDAQATSKLEPVPSVQLKFKIGTEDLAVRVALRDGVVHTEFRTDSPELRAALQQEWKAVAAQPESALRYLEPVVAAASSPHSGTNSFGQHQQQSPGQSAAQQQQQQQQQQQARAAEFFGSVTRSTPFQPREGGAAASRVPTVLPTSVHLSAVA